MTSLVAWVGLDSRGPASIYIATDSRLSKGKANWDCGRNVFACDRSASIFGYCGAVLFPSQFLGQLTQAIDSGMLFSESTRPQEKLDVIANKLSTEAERFPEQAEFTIVYATRVGEGLGATFFVARIPEVIGRLLAPGRCFVVCGSCLVRVAHGTAPA